MLYTNRGSQNNAFYTRLRYLINIAPICKIKCETKNIQRTRNTCLQQPLAMTAATSLSLLFS